MQEWGIEIGNNLQIQGRSNEWTTGIILKTQPRWNELKKNTIEMQVRSNDGKKIGNNLSKNASEIEQMKE